MLCSRGEAAGDSSTLLAPLACYSSLLSWPLPCRPAQEWDVTKLVSALLPHPHPFSVIPAQALGVRLETRADG